MIEGILGLAIDVAVPVAIGLIDLCAAILIASARPWRYLWSAEYRAQFDTQYASRHRLKRWLALGWGAAALMAGIAVVATVAWLLLRPAQASLERPQPRRSDAVQKAEQAVMERLPGAVAPNSR